ncbi:unnamed protein product, partial [Discosporangium mesarthrocarpum]
LSSGTSSGVQKMIPRTSRNFSLSMEAFFLISDMKAAKGIPNPSKSFSITRSGKERMTKSGLLAAPGTTHGLKVPAVQAMYEKMSTSPLAAVYLRDPRQSMYVHLFCALLRRGEVESIKTNFASVAYEAFQMLEHHWRMFVHHIRTGSPPLDDDPKLFSDVVTAITSGVVTEGGDPDLADELEAIFSAGPQGMMRRLFPRCSSVEAIFTGSMGIYAPLLRCYAGEDS